MTTVHILLPDQIAREAEQAGLLSPAAIERLLREQLRNQRIDQLFSAMDRMAAVDEPPYMSPEEIAEEIVSMRMERLSESSQ